MLWLIVPALFCLLIVWLLVAPLELKLDTTVPVMSVTWKGIGGGIFIYEKEAWRLRIHVLFFRHSWTLEQLLLSGKRKKTKKTAPGKKRSGKRSLRKILSVLKSFEIQHWRLAIDTGDQPGNALLYPINMVPGLKQHVFINFYGENYLVLDARNTAWRILHAFIK